MKVRYLVEGQTIEVGDVIAGDHLSGLKRVVPIARVTAKLAFGTYKGQEVYKFRRTVRLSGGFADEVPRQTWPEWVWRAARPVSPSEPRK